eukprot:5625602-Prymnesium_polylepis.2
MQERGRCRRDEIDKVRSGVKNIMNGEGGDRCVQRQDRKTINRSPDTLVPIDVLTVRARAAVYRVRRAPAMSLQVRIPFFQREDNKRE